MHLERKRNVDDWGQATVATMIVATSRGSSQNAARHVSIRRLPEDVTCTDSFGFRRPFYFPHVVWYARHYCCTGRTLAVDAGITRLEPPLFTENGGPLPALLSSHIGTRCANSCLVVVAAYGHQHKRRREMSTETEMR